MDWAIVRQGEPLKIRNRDVAETLGKAIATRIGEARYKLWFERHTRFRVEEDRLTVGVANRHFEEWLQKKFGAAVADAIREVVGKDLPVRFEIDSELFQAARREQAAVAQVNERGEPLDQANASAHSPIASEGKSPRKGGKKNAKSPTRPVPATILPEHAPLAPSSRGRRWKHLDDFVTGPCNRVSHAAAASVVEGKGDSANPLILHGPVGTGKTHLLEGIYAGLRKAQPSWRVCYATAEDFTNRFVQSMRMGKLGTFRKYFRACDALLLDDLHFLATKKATQEEFLHTFDDLFADGRQIVATCDCHPRLADDFTPELTDRLLGGVVWGLAPADAETRLAILHAKASHGRGGAVGEEVLNFLAQQLRGNVRELEGALHSVRHYAQVTGRPLDIPLVREALADLLRHAVRVVQLADIDRAVRAALGLETGALQAKGRAWVVSHPRMLAMFLARKHTAAAYSAIGAHFGGKNHSTAVAAEKKVRAWLETNAELTFGERQFRVRDTMERIERDLLL